MGVSNLPGSKRSWSEAGRPLLRDLAESDPAALERSNATSRPTRRIGWHTAAAIHVGSFSRQDGAAGVATAWHATEERH